MAKFDANKYNAEYTRTHYKQIAFRVPLYKKEVLAKFEELAKSKKVSSYIIQLVEDDMKNAQIIERIKK